METPVEKKLSQVLDGIAQLLLIGIYPASHAKLIVEACTVLEALSKSEAEREAAAPVVEETKLEVVESDHE
jgi:predicted urease superfamily metal-dependent hydrolase